MIMSDIYLSDINVAKDDDYTFVGMQRGAWDLKTSAGGLNWQDFTGASQFTQTIR